MRPVVVAIQQHFSTRAVEPSALGQEKRRKGEGSLGRRSPKLLDGSLM